VPSPGGWPRSTDVEIVTTEAFARLHPVAHHPDVPERLEVLLQAFPQRREPRPARVEEVRRCHDDVYVELIRSITGPTWLDPDTPASETTFEAALLAAGSAIEATEQSAFALARPPGHHALPDRGMGF
jgi:acetoin utilization deacetylase AcuC-like enzyme